MIVIDLDDANYTPLDPNGILSCFNYSNWDVMVANSGNGSKYYDVWALRDQNCNYDCWSKVYSDPSIPFDEAVKKYVKAHQRVIPKTDPLHPVDSAFNGLAIYKVSAIKPCCHYFGGTTSEVCEHVHFHQCLKSHGAKIFLNPAFCNGYVDKD
jgi:hypothetical protein